MKTVSFIMAWGVCCVLLMAPAHLRAQDAAAEKAQLYIGIAKNRQPYAYMDKAQQPQGTLLEKLDTLCDKIGASCKYVAGNFDQLLKDIQAYKLHGLLIIDHFVAPEIDRIRLTPPLCQLQPVFIQRQDNLREQQEDFRGTTIGVGYGSLLHLYLLDEYSSLSRLRPYYTLENGVFDLVSGRIDALFAEQAFFRARVAPTALTNPDNPARLAIRKIGAPEFPATSMTLAVQERNQELLKAFTEAIQADGKTPACACLPDKEQAAPNH